MDANQDGEEALVIKLAVEIFMEKTAWNNVAIIVTRPPAVIELQEGVREDVNQVGQESPVTMLVKNHSMEQTAHTNVEQTVSTLRVIM